MHRGCGSCIEVSCFASDAGMPYSSNARCITVHVHNRSHVNARDAHEFAVIRELKTLVNGLE